MGKLLSWTRQNPLVVGLTATTVVALIAAALNSHKLAQQRSAAEKTVRIAIEQRDKARTALEALVFDTFEELESGDFDAVQLQRQIIVQALEGLDAMDESDGSQLPDSQPLDLNRAAALMKLGLICLRMDEIGRGRLPFQVARQTLETLRQQTHRPRRREEDFLFVELLGNVAEFHVADNKIGSARAAFKEAISKAKAAVASYHEVEADRLLALAHINLATSDLWSAAKSRTHLQDAHKILERAVEREPKNEDVKRNVVFSASSLAFALRESGLVKQSQPHWSRALELAEQLHQQSEDDTGLLGNIADASEGLGDSLCSANEWPQALNNYQRAYTGLEKIVRSAGNDSGLRLGTWVLLHKLSFVSEKLGRPTDAERYHNLANEQMRSRADPRDSRPKLSLGNLGPNEVAAVMLELARFFRWHDEFSKSRQYYKNAKESLEKVASEARDLSWHRVQVEILYGQTAIADSSDDVRQRQLARKRLRQALQHAQDEFDGELTVWLGDMQKRIQLELKK